jgi:hypothetical protein
VRSQIVTASFLQRRFAGCEHKQLKEAGAADCAHNRAGFGVKGTKWPSSGGYLNKSGTPISAAEAAFSREPVYDSSGQRVVNPGPQTSFARRTATCSALNLSSKGSAVGAQTMQTDLLKTMFGGDKGPPTPPGIRMRGIYASPTRSLIALRDFRRLFASRANSHPGGQFLGTREGGRLRAHMRSGCPYRAAPLRRGSTYFLWDLQQA